MHNTTETAGATGIHRPYDGKLMAEEIVANDGTVWRRRNLLNGWGRWEVHGSIGGSA